jgi:NTE family protein
MLQRIRKWALWAMGILMALGEGCSQHYPVNALLKRYDPRSGYRIMAGERIADSESVLLFLTFSGGGTRAAAMAYGVLEELAQTEIEWKGVRRPLLDQVAMISSVSGGSFTAAYYGLFGRRVFQDFESRFLKGNIQKDLYRQTLDLGNWPRLWSSHFGRSDLAAECYHRNIFEGATFGDLMLRHGPWILINATDITTGGIFSFTQEYFDLICSDLSSFSVGRAVAASSAVPLLLSPITLYNFAGSCDSPDPPWMEGALQSSEGSKQKSHLALHFRSYRDAEKKPFIHLMDGGLSDNLGLRAILDQIIVRGGIGPFLESLGAEKVQRIAFVVVNAEKEPEADPSFQEKNLSSPSIMRAVARIPIVRYNLETIDRLRASFREWEKEIRSHRRARFPEGQGESSNVDGPEPFPEIRFDLVEVDFNALRDDREKQFFHKLPTSFSLNPQWVDRVKEVGRRILRESPAYQRLLRDLRPGVSTIRDHTGG